MTWKLTEGVNQFKEQSLEQLFAINYYTLRLFHGESIWCVQLEEDILDLGVEVGFGWVMRVQNEDYLVMYTDLANRLYC